MAFPALQKCGTQVEANVNAGEGQKLKEIIYKEILAILIRTSPS